MDYKPDVRLIDSHSKGDRSDNDVDFIIDPAPLHILLKGFGHLRVKVMCTYPFLLQLPCHLLCLFSCGAIYNPALFVIPVDDINNLIYYLRRLLWTNLIHQIGSIERTLKIVAPLYSQLIYYVFFDLGTSCCCQSQNRNIWEYPF